LGGLIALPAFAPSFLFLFPLCQAFLDGIASSHALMHGTAPGSPWKSFGKVFALHCFRLPSGGRNHLLVLGVASWRRVVSPANRPWNKVRAIEVEMKLSRTRVALAG
jgi:hypothetical protein